MAEAGGYYDDELNQFVEGANPKSVVINGGTFTGTEESGFGAFSVESVEINGGTFTGGMAGLWYNNVEKVVLKGGTFKATFRFSADYSLVENGGKVYMDDALVDAANYTSESGSTIIKLAKDYMNKLSSGEHTLKVEFNNGQTATTTFKVKGVSTTNPQTGDNITSYVCVFFIGLMAIVSTLYLIKKSENK